ncbi:hypothetical protein KY290_034540 [Solanum tuberosum]|uniref:Zinc finger LSD1-type domain-containing protein n=1 Tax=Solanum tuberosum TaxID=4113 RepID=A0ABQ7U5F1_SOLTU|nr:hypothetical protein KY284_033617 [Solanum tuberosum]KAH0741497.1 hypothetical protein KY290_034540 [Solanum tuberosum]
MPVPLAPYPTPPTPFTPPANGTQSQLVCSGCRNLLLYPVGATSVCCAVCNAVTAVPPPGTEMAQLVCGGCHTLLMYIRGATSVQCSCCHTVNLAMEGKVTLQPFEMYGDISYNPPSYTSLLVKVRIMVLSQQIRFQRAQLSKSLTANFKAAEPVLETSMTKVVELCVSGIAAASTGGNFYLLLV